VQAKDGPKVSVGVVHFLTQKTIDVENRPNANKDMQAAALKFCQDKGDGAALAFIGGDVNLDDYNKNVWGTDQIITAWDSLKKYPSTHGSRTIDVISRYKPDNTRFVQATSYPDSKLSLHTDHYLIDAWVEVT